jgi:hypothetical protein
MYIYGANVPFFQCFATLLVAVVAIFYPTLIISLIVIACTQIDKLNAAILDIRQQHITPQRGKEDGQVHENANCVLQAKLHACIQHHQDIIE